MPEVVHTAGEVLLWDVPIPHAVFNQIRGLMYQRFGIALGPNKKDLVAARLTQRLRLYHLRSYEDYFELVLHDRSGLELASMVDALTTNFTSFFREPEHFEFLDQTVLPQIRDQTSISVWSAGCATGEEPYSIACWLLEKLGPPRGELYILATDISTRALETAQRGAFPEARFSRLTEAWRRRFLLRGSGKWAGWYRFKPEVQRLVRFQYFNLNESLTAAGVFDVVLCRNVMIYFDQAARDRLLSKVAHQVKVGGYFLPGHAESMPPIIPGLRRVVPAVYQRTETL